MPDAAEGQSRAAGAAGLRDHPLIRRFFADPVAAKVPEIIPIFWLIKILTTAGGEAGSDYLAHYGNVVGGGIVLVVFVAGILVQFGTRQYRAFAYWFFAYAIAIFGTAAADFLHLDVGIPYAGTSIMWAVVLAGVFWIWQRSEGTLSIHSITTRRRECFYWATVLATFALGTALGDYTAFALNLGFLTSGVLFGVIILIPAVAWWKFRHEPGRRLLVRLRRHAPARCILRGLSQQATQPERRRLRRRPHLRRPHAGGRRAGRVSHHRPT